jgi:hypothetical protein
VDSIYFNYYCVLCFKLVFVAVTAGRRLLSRRRLRPPQCWRHRHLVAAAPARECTVWLFSLTLALVLRFDFGIFGVFFFRVCAWVCAWGWMDRGVLTGRRTAEDSHLTPFSDWIFILILFDFVVDFFCS